MYEAYCTLCGHKQVGVHFHSVTAHNVRDFNEILKESGKHVRVGQRICGLHFSDDGVLLPPPHINKTNLEALERNERAMRHLHREQQQKLKQKLENQTKQEQKLGGQ